MKYCPNFNIPSVRQEFEELTSIVGEDYAYYLWNKNKGLPLNLKEENGKEVPNTLFNDFLGAFNNNPSKATFAYIIQLSKPFLKQNPGYEKLSSIEKIKLIHKYVNSSDEELQKIGKSIIKKLPKGYSAEFYQSGGVDENSLVVDRNTIRRYRNQVDQQTESLEEIKERLPENGRLIDAVVDFRENQFNQGVVINNLQRTIVEGKFAEWAKDAINLYNGSDYTDLYHESWHNFSQKVFTPQERLALYSIVKSRVGTVKMGGVTIAYANLTSRQADEILAEEYRQFAIDKKLNEKQEDLDRLGSKETEGNVKNIFQRVYNLLKSLFSSKEVKPTTNPLEVDKIREIFEVLNQGIVKRGYVPTNENISESIISRSKEIELTFIDDEGEKLDQVISSVEMAEVFNAIDFWIKEAMSEKGITYSFLNNKEQRKEYTPLLYDQVKLRFSLFLEKLENELEDPTLIEGSQEYHLLEQKKLTIQWLLSSSELGGDNWQRVVDHHKSFSKGRVFDFNKDNDQDDDRTAADDFDESQAVRDQRAKWDDKATNPEDLIPPTVIEMLKSLPNIDNQGNVIYSSELGLPTVADFKQTKNLLLNNLAGIRSYSEVIEKIKQLSEFAPYLKGLTDQLPDPSKEVLTADELILKAQFLQSLTMPSIDPISVKMEAKYDEEIEGNVLKATTFLNNTLTVDTLNQYFDQDFKENTNRLFRNTSEEDQTSTFNLDSAYLEINKRFPNGLNTDQELLEFYKLVFGIDLIQGKADKMFSNNGKYREGSTNYINRRSLDNLREFALHMYHKLNLLRTINYDDGFDKQFKIELNLNSISNPLTYFSTDISQKLKRYIESKDLNENSETKKYFAKYFKQTTVSSQRKLVYDVISKVYTDFQSNSFITAEGTMEWSIRQRNHVLSVAEKINQAKTVNDLPEHLHPSVNAFVTKSAWFEKMFNENGERNVGQNGEPIYIKITNFSDFKVASYDGKKTTNLTSDDKFIQDFLSFIQDAVFENIRFGSKASSFASSVGNNRKERLYYQAEDFVNEESIIPGVVLTQFKRYLEFELIRIFRSTRKSESEKTRNEQFGSNLLFFADILPSTTNKEKQLDIVANTKGYLEGLAKSAISEEELLKEFNTIYRTPSSGLRSTFQKSLTEYFTKEVNEHKQLLADIINEGDLKTLPKQFARIRPREKEYTDQDLDYIMGFYLTNYVTHQLEFTNLLVGDVTNYKGNIKDNNIREMFKRLGPSVSPGLEPLLDEQDLRSINSRENDLGRNIENVFTGSSRPFTDKYKVVVFKDVQSFNVTREKDNPNPKYLEEIKKTQLEEYAKVLAKQAGRKKPNQNDYDKALEDIGDSIDVFLNQDEESNAQAYATLDFVRFYLNSIGEWTPEQTEQYNHEVEVAKAIMDYRNNPTPENFDAVQNLINQSNKGIIQTLKLGHYGAVSSKLDEMFTGKYSVLPLLPSAVFNTELEDRMIDMYKSGTDFITSESGAKTSKPAKLINHYKDVEGVDSYQINEIQPENQFDLFVDGLRRQQYMAPKFKNTSTLSSQMVKLLFSNFYVNGEFSPELAHIKGLNDKINELQDKFIDNLETIIEAEKSKILVNIGARLDFDNNIIGVDFKMFEKWLKSEFDKKDLSPALYDYVESGLKGFVRSLDASPHRNMIEQVISAAVSKRIVRPKLFGEAYVQIASTGFNRKNTRYKNISKSNYKKITEKYGLTGFLRDYRIENGVTQPADVAVAFNPKKHAGLLNLTFNGKVIGTITQLNNILEGDTEDKKAWVEEHSKKLFLVGVRIPVQGFNSMEYFKIRRFLPESVGPVIIVPPSIVTKSGSDFDIDKLFMYEPTITENGNLINEELSDVDTSKDVMYEAIRDRKLYKEKYLELKNLFAPYKKNAILQSQIDEDLKQDLLKALNKIEELLKKSNSSEYFEEFEDNAYHIKVQLNLIESRQKEAFKRNYTNHPLIAPGLKEFEELRSLFYEYYNYTASNIKGIASNNLLDSMQGVLSEPSLFKFLIKPNESPILKSLSARYNKLRSDKNKITYTSAYFPRISLTIYEQNTLAMKALGIDAKTNALHKLYQQVGLRITDSLLNKNYRLKSNKQDGQIILGGLKDSDGVNYISDIVNEFINGHVDAEKEDWINYFNADKDRTAIILQMVLNGTPIEDAIITANQPIVQYYIRLNRNSSIKKALGIDPIKIDKMYEKIFDAFGGKYKLQYEGGLFNESKTIDYLLKDALINDRLSEFNSGRNSELEKDEFKPYVDVSTEEFNEILKLKDSNPVEYISKLSKQLAMFTQFRTAALQNQALRELNSVIDFNTNKYRTINDFYRTNSVIEESRQYFNSDAIDKIINRSVVSSFNVSNFALSIYDFTFDVLSKTEVQDIILNFEKEYGKYWSNDKKVKEVTSFVNAIVHSLIQNYDLNQSLDFYNEYGPTSDYLTYNYNPKKSLNIILSKIKQIQDPGVKKFIDTNLLFRNLTYDIIPNTGITRLPIDGSGEKKVYEKFYMTVRTNDKDTDFIGSMQKAWLDIANFNGSENNEYNKMIQEFGYNMAFATLIGQGFEIKYRSLHPYIPIQLIPNVGMLQYISNLKEAFDQQKSNPNPQSEEAITDFKELVTNVLREFSKRFDKGQQKNYTKFNKYFPKYVFEKQGRKTLPVNVSSESKGLGAKLTNPTQLAKFKGNLDVKNVDLKKKYGKNHKYIYYYDFRSKSLKSSSIETYDAVYPIVYKGKLYADVEAAYQDNKSVYLVTKTTDKLMKELIDIKFQTYPALLREVYKVGGIEFLEKSTHNVADKYWGSQGEDMFMKVLRQSYLDNESIVSNSISNIDNNKYVSSSYVNRNIDFQENQSSEYKERTIINASADATIAIAYNFNSKGEELTKSSVLNQNKLYLPVSTDVFASGNDVNMAAGIIAKELNKLPKNEISLNIAGNGIYTLKEIMTQNAADNFTLELLQKVIERLNPEKKIVSIRTGGQTGFDEAGAKAGIKLDIPTTILAPKGWKFRDSLGNDISDEQAFKSRFMIQEAFQQDEYTGEDYDQFFPQDDFVPQENDTYKEEEEYDNDINEPSFDRSSLPFGRKKEAPLSKVDSIINENSIDNLRAMSFNDMQSKFNLTPQEINELLSKICQ